MKRMALLIAACILLGLPALAQDVMPAPETGIFIAAEEPADPGFEFFSAPIPPPGDGLFNFEVAAPDGIMFAGAQAPAPAPPGFGWQGEAGERVFFRSRHPGPELGKWWKDSKIAAELKLTPAQINQIEQSFFDHRLKLIDLRADLEREETRLQPLMEADQVDEAKVSAQIDLVLAARGRLEKHHTMMMLALRRSLSVEQWKKLEAIKQEREHRWGGHPAMAPGRSPHPAHPAQPAQPATPGTPPTTPKPGDRM